MLVRSKRSPSHYLRWTLLGSLSGILSGIAAAIFLILLDLATRYRDSHQELIWLLPLAGFAIGWAYYHHGKDVAGGHNLILDEIHDPKKVTPFHMAPFILVGTVATHLFGGSAGREGTAVQMGASLSDQLTKFFRIEPEERKILLVCGAGAGFGAAIGAPWAGVIFGMEVISVGRLRLFALFECFIASFVAFYFTHLLHAPHTHYPFSDLPSFSWGWIPAIVVAGIAFGLSARLFVKFTHIVENLQGRFVSYPPLKPVIAGIILVALYHLIGTYRYAGLGIPVIQEGLVHQARLADPVLKGIFTAITVGSGFKGGEFIPLVFMGTTLGSALSAILPVPVHLLAALGFAAVFGGAANTPIACSIMAVELFGVEVAPFALIACLTSYYFSGHHGIYRSQRILVKKHHKLLAVLTWLGELPRRFLNGNGNGNGSKV
jgi:H+/Cl- antiporter ClcA